MKRTMSSVFVLLAMTSAAYAKDVCVSDPAPALGSPKIVFSKVKALKPGGAIALNGFAIVGAESFPVTGTARMASNGSAKFGVFAHGMNPGGCPSGCISYGWVMAGPDGSFNASGSVDLNGDNASDLATIWTVVDCDTVIAP